jgi:hypothetical protein
MQKMIKKQSFLKRIVMLKVYNSLDKPTAKANKKFQKYLGKKLEVFVRKELPEFESPTYVNSNNYVRTGQQIVLYPNANILNFFLKIKATFG